MLAATPLEVIYSPTFSSLAEAQYDILLVGIPVSMRDLSPHREKLAKACAMSDNVLLALPCHAQVSAEALKRDGVAACLLKPLTTT
ncbi:two-component sensor histidine kinase BarA, partial [Acinetobacter baumannii]|nr:two-component sensor histidine kinase BarA [Acinetobacter baumannii]